MLDKTKQESFDALVAVASYEELIWMNGFLAGTLSTRKKPSELPSGAKQALKITIVYGTETGNARNLAGKLGAWAKSRGLIPRVIGLDQYRLTDLAKEQLLFIVISTQGDGDPPSAALKFYDFIHATGDLPAALRYGVIALGDSAYPQFCKTGKEVDERLAALGATRISARKDCDTDYEEPALDWFRQAIALLEGQAVSAPVPQSAKTSSRAQQTGTILRNINLNDRGSNKETHHIEIAAEDVEYEPGDALGIVPHNPQPIIDSVLALAGMKPAEQVVYKGQSSDVAGLLREKLNISCLPLRLVKRYAEIVQQAIPEVAIGLFDLLSIYPVRDTAQFRAVIGILEPIVPRLYSIASSPAAHEGELHLTVKRDVFYLQDEQRFGLCSDYLSQLPEGSAVSFYIHRNKRFRLPAPDQDIIMISAGTGVAPFRSFVAERNVTGAEGRNWLFFGEQHYSTDFLYQTEWQAHKDNGVLSRVSLAFSRDQQEKIYVQHRMLEEGAAIYEWLSAGASLYVCGAKEPMSVDVEHALLRIIAEHGNKSEEEAQSHLRELEETGRYLKDVY